MNPGTREGFFFGLLAYGWWGLMPLYLRQVRIVPPLEILAYRIVFSLGIMFFLLTWTDRWNRFANCFRNGHHRSMLIFTSVLIAANWFLYIYCVDVQRIKEASLGYFITPLVNILLGLIFFREKLRPFQWVALALAVLGVILQGLLVDIFPWAGLGLAFSFSFYGMFRKRLPVDGITGLSAETVVLTPIALLYLGMVAWKGSLVLFLHEGNASLFSQPRSWSLSGPPWILDLLILGMGLVTAVPLIAFGQAARLLPLSTLGFLQYLSPSIQFMIAVFLFGEVFQPEEWFSFLCIWSGLAIFTVDAYLALRRWSAAPETGVDTPEED